MTYAQMKRILLYCRVLGYEGLKNGNSATIPELKIDLSEKNAFIGVRGNPAIFVSEATYKKLKRFHEDWIPNITIAISLSYILEPKRSSVDVIGVLIHEAGHAFNVYAKIQNTEANAYVFEIEAMIKLFNMSILSGQFDLSKTDLKTYFQSRLDQYCLETHNNPYLTKLVDYITDSFELNSKGSESVKHVNVQTEIGFFKQDKQNKTPAGGQENEPAVKGFIQTASL
jgi:hypothetical protein